MSCITVTTYVFDWVTITRTGTITLPAGYTYTSNVWHTVTITKYSELGTITRRSTVTTTETVHTTVTKTYTSYRYSTSKIYTTKLVPKSVGVTTEVITKQVTAVPV
jgi:hypothetical protein